MKLKRFFAILLTAATLLCLFCACGKKEEDNSSAVNPSMEKYKAGEDAYAIYSAATEQTNKLSAYSLEMVMSSKISYGSETNTRTSKTVRMADLTDESDPVAYYSVSQSENGETQSESILYYADGTLYQISDENITSDEFAAADIVGEFKNPFPFIYDEDVLSCGKTDVTDDGVISIVCSSDDKALIPVVSSFDTSGDNSLANSAKNISMNIKIDAKGYISSIIIGFDAELEEDGVANQSVTLEFVEPGTRPEIPAPDALSDYDPDAEAPVTDAPTADTAENGSASHDTEPASRDTEPAETEEMSDEEMAQIMEEQGEVVEAAFDLLDENFEPKPDFDERYKEACDKYGKDSIDTILYYIMALAPMRDGN